jgi:hypothetical protein
MAAVVKYGAALTTPPITLGMKPPCAGGTPVFILVYLYI